MAEKQAEMFGQPPAGQPEQQPEQEELSLEELRAVTDVVGIKHIPNEELQQIDFALYLESKAQKRAARKILEEAITKAARPHAQIGPDGRIVPPPNPVKEKKPRSSFNAQTMQAARQLAKDLDLDLADPELERFLGDAALFVNHTAYAGSSLLDILRLRLERFAQQQRLASTIDFTRPGQELTQPAQPD